MQIMHIKFQPGKKTKMNPVMLRKEPFTPAGRQFLKENAKQIRELPDDSRTLVLDNLRLLQAKNKELKMFIPKTFLGKALKFISQAIQPGYEVRYLGRLKSALKNKTNIPATTEPENVKKLLNGSRQRLLNREFSEIIKNAVDL